MSDDIDRAAVVSSAASEAAVALASKATWWGSITAFVTALVSNPVALTSLLVALLGVIVNLYYSHQRNRREALQELRNAQREQRELAEHEARMRKLARDSAAMPLQVKDAA